VSLIAPSDSGPLALLARPMLTGLARTVIHLGGFEEGDGSGPVPAGLDLPGSLQFGGLKAAAALSAPAPLWLLGVPEGFAREWPVKAYGLVDAGGMLRLENEPVDTMSLARWIDAGE
ncbi:MAG TPA: acetyl xylan esterase, partial [Isosphaeraceae bacterium]